MKNVLLGLLLVLNCSVGAQEYELASRVYGGPQMDEVRAVVETLDGGYTLLGTTASVSGDATDFYLLHILEDLSYAWSRPYGGIESDQGRSLEQYENGDLLIAGFTNDSPAGEYDALVFRTDEDGDVIWEKNFGTTEWDFCEDIALLDDGSFILVGSTYAGSGGRNAWVMKADENGNILWDQILESPFDNWAEDVLLTSAGTLLIARNIQLGEEESSLRPSIVEMDLNGDILSEQFYGETQSTFYEIGEDADSYVAVGWYLAEGASDRGQLVTGIDISLMQEWQILEVSPGDLALHAIVDTPYGWVTTGPGNGLGAGGYEAYIQSRQDGGWYIQGYETGGVKDEVPHDVIIDSQQRIVVCGSSASYSTFEDMDAHVVRSDSVMVLPNYTETYDAYTDVSLDTQNEWADLGFQVWISGQEVRITMPSSRQANLQLVNASGSLVKQETGRHQLTVSLEDLPHGLYILNVVSGDLRFSQKLVR